MQYKHKSLLIGISVIVVAIFSFSLLTAQEMDEPNLIFVNHILAGMAEQDVYLATDDGMVQRIPGDVPLASIGESIYAAAETQEHDPFALGETPLGPFEMGTELGITLGDWLKAGGTGTYAVEDDVAQIELVFDNLVPGGVYTTWCSVVALPPESTVVDSACAQDVSENAFTADENGHATFSVTAAALPSTTETSLSMVVLAYHSDGNTYGEHPGDFGFNSHVHIFAIIPPVG